MARLLCVHRAGKGVNTNASVVECKGRMFKRGGGTSIFGRKGWKVRLCELGCAPRLSGPELFGFFFFMYVYLLKHTSRLNSRTASYLLSSTQHSASYSRALDGYGCLVLLLLVPPVFVNSVSTWKTFRLLESIA